MSKARQYKDSDLKKLFALSGNNCAMPGCPRKMIADDGNTVIGKICHIEAASSKGPRWNRKSNDDVRRSFDNLILMCSDHHDEIDNKANLAKYTTPYLKSIKHDHENGNSTKAFEVKESHIEQLHDQLDEILSAVYDTQAMVLRVEDTQMLALASLESIKSGVEEIKKTEKTAPEFTQLQKLVDDYKRELKEGTEDYKTQIEKIQHYVKNIDTVKKDLSEKLIDGGFETEIDFAKELKEQYVKKLLKNDVSATQQKIHALILVKVQMAFRRHVLTAIREDANKSEVRQLIDDKVINQVAEYIGYDNVLDLYDDDINGMVYFLTGNCHLIWN